MGMTLKLTQNVLNTYVDWKAQVLHDLHESVPYLYDNTIGDGPYNAWIDPLLTNEWQMIGWNNVQEMTRMGMPGVFAHGNFDTWSPGYLMFIAATHNGISRLYETFGNGGSAETRGAHASARTRRRGRWFQQNPPLPRVKWSLRNNNNYEQTGLARLAQLLREQPAAVPPELLREEQAVDPEGEDEGPGGVRADRRRSAPGRQAELLRVLQKQRVEISRATGGRSPSAPARRRVRTRLHAAEQRATSTRPDARVPGRQLHHPHGPAVLAHRRRAARLPVLGAERSADSSPYDDTGWTFPEGFDVQAVASSDPKVLDVPMERVSGDDRAPGGVGGTGSVFAINHNADNALATLRYQFKDADFQAAEEPFEAGGQQVQPRLVHHQERAAGRSRQGRRRSSGSRRTRSAAAPSVKTHPARAARVAIMHTWPSTQTEGWWRQAFDQLHDPVRLHQPAGRREDTRT